MEILAWELTTGHLIVTAKITVRISHSRLQAASLQRIGVDSCSLYDVQSAFADSILKVATDLKEEDLCLQINLLKADSEESLDNPSPINQWQNTGSENNSQINLTANDIDDDDSLLISNL